MRVVFVPPFPFSFRPLGGGVIQVLKTKEYLEKLGVEVEIWNPAINYAAEKKADLLHIFSSDWPLAQLAALARNCGYPYVVSTVFWQNSLAKCIGHAAMSRIPLTQTYQRRQMLLGASFLLPNSEAEANQIRKVFGIHREKLIPIPNSVDRDYIGLDPDRFRELYLPDLPLQTPFVLSVANLEGRKNTLTLLRAARAVGVPLVLVGKPLPGDPYGAQVLQEIAEFSRRAYVKHIPFIAHEELRDAYAAAKVHALVSFVETPGISTLEAGLNGANLVVSKLPTVMEYVGRVAWAVNPRSVGEVARALEEALNAPRDCKGASQLISKKYTWEVTARATLEVYRKVVIA